MRPSVLVVLACGVAGLTLTAEAQQIDNALDVKQVEALVKLGGTQRRELLWILEDDPKTRQRPGYHELNAALKKCKIATSKEAGGAAIQFVLDERSGLLAQETFPITGLLCLGRDVPGFGSEGDFVWVVQFVKMIGAHKSVAGGVTQEFWVNAANGNVRAMLPMRR